MNEILKIIALNPGKTIGIFCGFLLGLFISIFGILKTIFIILLVILGYFLGKWYDEGISLKNFLKSIISNLRIDKWQ